VPERIGLGFRAPGPGAQVAAGFLDGLAAGIHRDVQLVPLACVEPTG
jgi:hypothetical protein